MFNLTNKVTKLVQQAEMEGTYFVLADGSGIPFTTPQPGIFLTKVYNVDEVVEEVKAPKEPKVIKTKEVKE